jgi:hypothetical protein
MRRSNPVIIMIVVFIIFSVIMTGIQYSKEDTVVATVKSITIQQNISGADGNIGTSYVYLIGTDKGIMQIEPSGIMSSKVFGQLKEGNTYRMHIRGYSFPLVGCYPYIIDANKE